METLLFAPAPDLFGMALRATVVLGAAVLVARLLSRFAAETRHLLWTATFVLLLGLPAAMVWMPAWELPLLPPAYAPPVAAATALVPEAPPGATPVDVAPDVPLDKAPLNVLPPASHTADVASEATLPLPVLMFWIWALGCGVCVLSMGVGLVRYWALVRTATPLVDPAWVATTNVLRSKLRIRRRVRLCVSARVDTPMTGGWQRPVILLPEGATDWSAERRAVVLAHELVHVQRHDALRHLIGHATLAVYWFHPLSWLAVRLAKLCRELACDEGVLALGTRPSTYAAHLLALADGLTPAPAPAALPMIQKPQLEARLMAILKPNRPRTHVLANAVALLLMVGIGLTAAVARPAPPSAPPAVASPDETQTDVAPMVLPDQPAVAPGVDSVPFPLPAFKAPDVRLADERCQFSGSRGTFSGTFSATIAGAEKQEKLAGWDEGDRMIQTYEDGLRLCMRIHGAVDLSENGRTVRAIKDGGWIVLETEADRLHRLVIKEGPGGLAHTWQVDGQAQPFDDQARQWRDQMLVVMHGYWNASRLRGQEATLKGDIATHKGEVATYKGEIATHRGEVATLKGEIATHRGEMATLKGEIATHRGEVATLKGEIATHRGEVATLKGEIATLRGELSSMRGYGANQNAADRQAYEKREAEVETRIQAIQKQIAAYNLDGKVQAIEAQLADFDLDGKVRPIEAQLADFDLDGKVRPIEAQLAAYNLDDKVQAIEAKIAAYDLDNKINALEKEIEDLDADRRATEIERTLKPELNKLRALIR